MKRGWYLIPLSLVMVCVITAIVVRVSYADMGRAIYDYPYSALSDTGDLDNAIYNTQVNSNLAALLSPEDFTIRTPQDCIDKADLIVKVKFTGNRKITKNAFYSTVQIEQIYKGDSTLQKQSICIVESQPHILASKLIKSYKGWIPLQDGREYVMLLHKPIFDPRRNLNKLQQTEYFPITESPLSCFLLDSPKQTHIMYGSNQTYTINTLKGYDIFAASQVKLDQYYQYRNSIFQQLSIN